jgi:hypothetical protein
MDFIAYLNKNFDFNWEWPKNEITVKLYIDCNSFTLEGAIGLASLRKFNLIKNNTIETGIFRAKYNKRENLIFEPTWLSWVNPQTKTPNFHTTSSFGILNIIK